MTTEADIAVVLGRRIRRAREAANLSQEELAGQLGCSVRSLQEYEAGRALPRPSRRRRIATFLTEAEEVAA